MWKANNKRCFDTLQDPMAHGLAHNLTIRDGDKYFTIDTGSTQELFTEETCYEKGYHFDRRRKQRHRYGSADITCFQTYRDKNTSCCRNAEFKNSADKQHDGLIGLSNEHYFLYDKGKGKFCLDHGETMFDEDAIVMSTNTDGKLLLNENKIFDTGTSCTAPYGGMQVVGYDQIEYLANDPFHQQFAYRVGPGSRRCEGV